MSFLGNLGEGSGDVLSKCPDMQSFFIYVGVILKVLVKKGPWGMHFLQGGVLAKDLHYGHFGDKYVEQLPCDKGGNPLPNKHGTPHGPLEFENITGAACGQHL